MHHIPFIPSVPDIWVPFDLGTPTIETVCFKSNIATSTADPVSGAVAHGGTVSVNSVFGLKLKDKILFYSSETSMSSEINSKVRLGEYLMINMETALHIRHHKLSATIEKILIQVKCSKVEFEDVPDWVTNKNPDIMYSKHWSTTESVGGEIYTRVHVFSSKRTCKLRFICFTMDRKTFQGHMDIMNLRKEIFMRGPENVFHQAKVTETDIYNKI